MFGSYGSSIVQTASGKKANRNPNGPHLWFPPRQTEEHHRRAVRGGQQPPHDTRGGAEMVRSVEDRKLLERPIWCEVLPDLLEHLRIDDSGVSPLELLLRVQHEPRAPARGPQRAGGEGVETLVDHLALRDAPFELEGMNRLHLG